MGTFEEADLPLGERAIRLKWVYTFKTDADGCNIPGKEKARCKGNCKLDLAKLAGGPKSIYLY